ncbi:ELM1/GtrOC1 family putative glycosyltransferase [Lichenicoccus sp.]|uniref:ELM1/GtrOC1 family putative glycosyltransferase n=1 Tax=Lichenicoccus sp. TaxID=2781899 RepID=UPI003D0C67BA
MSLALLPQPPVWVLDDPGSAVAGQASAIAGRLGMPFRRLNATPGQPHRPGGPGPGLVISAGRRAGLRALLLRSRHACRVVHCSPTRLSAMLSYDLVVLPQQACRPAEIREAGRLVPVLGPPHVVSPALLGRARELWTERLSHMPHPRLLLIFGSADGKLALQVGRHVASLARERGGCVLVSVLAPGLVAADALSAALSNCLHLLYRAGEPGENPTLGFLSHADAVVTVRVGALTLSEACAGQAPVFAAHADGETGAAGRFLADLQAAGQVRPLQHDLSRWSRQPLDEAGRIALMIQSRFGHARPTIVAVPQTILKS